MSQQNQAYRQARAIQPGEQVTISGQRITVAQVLPNDVRTVRIVATDGRQIIFPADQFLEVHPPAQPAGPFGQTPQFAPARPKKKRTALKIIAGAVAAMIGLGIVASLADDPATTPATTPEPKSTADEPKATTEPVEEEPEIPGIGDEARDGDLTFVVAGLEPGPEMIGDEFLNVKPQGRFVMVELTITNHSDEAVLFTDTEQILIDRAGRRHEADSEAGIYLPDNETWLEDINPGNSVNGTLVFDIPKDAEPVAVELHDSMFSNGVTVDVTEGGQ